MIPQYSSPLAFESGNGTPLCMKVIYFVVQKIFLHFVHHSIHLGSCQYLSVCYGMQGRRHHQGSTRSERLHYWQGLHPTLPALPGIWHPTWLSGHWFQILLYAQVSGSCLLQLPTICSCGRKPCDLVGSDVVCVFVKACRWWSRMLQA